MFHFEHEQEGGGRLFSTLFILEQAGKITGFFWTSKCLEYYY